LFYDEKEQKLAFDYLKAISKTIQKEEKKHFANLYLSKNDSLNDVLTKHISFSDFIEILEKATEYCQMLISKCFLKKESFEFEEHKQLIKGIKAHFPN
jgi:hypothetical protein